MYHYATGATAIEAYWKSVAWPVEGVFVGEPLARPFGPALLEVKSGNYELTLHSPIRAQLHAARANSPVGPYVRAPGRTSAPTVSKGHNRIRFALPNDDHYFKLLIVPSP